MIRRSACCTKCLASTSGTKMADSCGLVNGYDCYPIRQVQLSRSRMAFAFFTWAIWLWDFFQSLQRKAAK